MTRSRTSLSLRLALFAALLVSLAGGTVGLVLTRRATLDLEQALEKRGGAIARGLATQVAGALAERRVRRLQEILDGVWAENDIARAEVVDVAGHTVAERIFGPDPASDTSVLDGAVVAYPVTGEPDEDGFQEAMGLVRVTLSAAGVDAQRQAWVQRAVLVAGAVAVAGGLLAVALALAMASPLRRLHRAARQLAAGTYPDAQAFNIDGPQEVVDLALALTEATSAVAAREFALAEANDALADTNEALAEANLALGTTNDALGHSNDALAAAVAALRRTEQARDGMTHMLIHDLKGPLSNILMLLGILESGAPVEDRPLIAEGRNRCQALMSQIEDLLALARLEAGHATLDLRPTRLDAVVARAVESVKRLAADRGFELSVNVPAIESLVDGRLLERVLVNLITNAFKYGASPVRVSAADDHEFVTLVVADAGRGVPEADARRVFDKFQGSGRGAGLGLAFVREVAEAHGGSARVVGSAFTVTLARRPSSGRAVA